jgi:Fe2+ or Zn2+ uptake regulation protein
VKDIFSFLKAKGIRPTSHRLAVGEYIFNTATHPSAEDVLKTVKRRHPAISRATVYNVLDLFVRKGLLRRRLLREGMVVFDPMVEPHHHFIDEKTGAIFDVPLDACRIAPASFLDKFEIHEYHVVMRGSRKKSQARGEGLSF